MKGKERGKGKEQGKRGKERETLQIYLRLLLSSLCPQTRKPREINKFLVIHKPLQLELGRNRNSEQIITSSEIELEIEKKNLSTTTTNRARQIHS